MSQVATQRLAEAEEEIYYLSWTDEQAFYASNPKSDEFMNSTYKHAVLNLTQQTIRIDSKDIPCSREQIADIVRAKANDVSEMVDVAIDIAENIMEGDKMAAFAKTMTATSSGVASSSGTSTTIPSSPATISSTSTAAPGTSAATTPTSGISTVTPGTSVATPATTKAQPTAPKATSSTAAIPPAAQTSSVEITSSTAATAAANATPSKAASASGKATTKKLASSVSQAGPSATPASSNTAQVSPSTTSAGPSAIQEVADGTANTKSDPAVVAAAQLSTAMSTIAALQAQLEAQTKELIGLKQRCVKNEDTIVAIDAKIKTMMSEQAGIITTMNTKLLKTETKMDTTVIVIADLLKKIGPKLGNLENMVTSIENRQ